MNNEAIRKWSGRYWILFFDCTMVMGIYYCVDVPSAMQSQLQRKPTNCSMTNEIHNKSCCSECLGLGPDKYNQLYAIYSLTNAILVFPAGVFVDRFGNRISSLIFTGSTLIGSVSLALAVTVGVRGTSYMFILMMAGRMLIGAGTGSSIIVQDRVVFVWFWDHLAIAFGIITSTLRIGSVLNFLITSKIAVDYGLSWALWLGAGMCLICFLSAVALSAVDKYGEKKCLVEAHSSTSRTTLRDIKSFPASFWIVCVMIATYYNFLIVYISNGSKFLEDTYGYDRKKAANINGILYETTILLCPVVGQINQKWGLRLILATVGSLLTALVLPLMLFTGISPITCNIFMGIFYCFTVQKWGLRLILAAVGSLLTAFVLLLMLFTGISPIACNIFMGIFFCLTVLSTTRIENVTRLESNRCLQSGEMKNRINISLWPCIALIVPIQCVGTANGIAALMQYASVAVTSFGVGKLLGHIEGTSEEHQQWVYVIFILVGHLSITVVCGVYLNIRGFKRGHFLNRPTSKYLDISETEHLIQSPD